MTTMMVELIVLRPRGQESETFEHPDQAVPYGEVVSTELYSYQVLSGNVLKIYAHPCEMNSDGEFLDFGDEVEVAHFRPSQWDSVRQG